MVRPALPSTASAAPVNCTVPTGASGLATGVVEEGDAGATDLGAGPAIFLEDRQVVGLEPERP